MLNALKKICASTFEWWNRSRPLELQQRQTFEEWYRDLYRRALCMMLNPKPANQLTSLDKIALAVYAGLECDFKTNLKGTKVGFRTRYGIDFKNAPDGRIIIVSAQPPDLVSASSHPSGPALG
jgi:hypothetical protein